MVEVVVGIGFQGPDGLVGTIARFGTCLHRKDFRDPVQSLADPDQDQKEGKVVFAAYGVEKIVIRASQRAAAYSLARDPVAATAYSAGCRKDREDTCLEEDL